MRRRFQDREVIDRDSAPTRSSALPEGLRRHGTPGEWREAMEVFTEVNRIGMDAYDELAEGGNLLSTSHQTTTTAAGGAGSSAASGTSALTAAATSDGSVRESTKVTDPPLWPAGLALV